MHKRACAWVAEKKGTSLCGDREAVTARTWFACISLRLLSTPFWCLLSLMVFILYKQAQLSPWQVTLLIALKPMSSLLSPYWSHAICKRPDRILTNLAGANFLRHLPFLGILWIDASWYILLAFGIYMTLTRALIPAWMELVKINLPGRQREGMVSSITTIDFLGTALFAVGAGLFLDAYPDWWRELFAFSALLGMIGTAALLWVPPPIKKEGRLAPPSILCREVGCEKYGLAKEAVRYALRPWKEVGALLRRRTDFLFFQIGFMLGGGGLMLMQPALPHLFVDTFHLSYTEMSLALSLCKGVGVALTSSLWTRLFRKITLFQLSAFVTLCATLFPFLLLATSLHLALLYIAYIFYGAMQAGSELSWHMSGLVFAREEESAPFSITNVLTVGVRGSLLPTLGALLLPTLHTVGVILFGACFCLLASLYFFSYRKKTLSV